MFEDSVIHGGQPPKKKPLLSIARLMLFSGVAVVGTVAAVSDFNARTFATKTLTVQSSDLIRIVSRFALAGDSGLAHSRAGKNQAA